MPTISMLYGIPVNMYLPDTDRHHSLDIHIRYNDYKVVVRIPDSEVLDGSMLAKQMKIVQAWIVIHQEDLMADWQLAREGQWPFKIVLIR